jgi:hypothetical protein
LGGEQKGGEFEDGRRCEDFREVTGLYASRRDLQGLSKQMISLDNFLEYSLL